MMNMMTNYHISMVIIQFIQPCLHQTAVLKFQKSSLNSGISSHARQDCRFEILNIYIIIHCKYFIFTGTYIIYFSEIININILYLWVLKKNIYFFFTIFFIYKTTSHQFETLNLNDDKRMSLQLQREALRIEEPKPQSGYQLFARTWKKAQTTKIMEANNKLLVAAWNELTPPEKAEWNKKSDEAKIQYNLQKEKWQKYVQEAKGLVCNKMHIHCFHFSHVLLNAKISGHSSSNKQISISSQ